MASWAELQAELAALTPAQAGDWVSRKFRGFVGALSAHTDTNVIFYASAFLQKPLVPSVFQAVAAEDINGFMAAVHGLNCDRGLTLLLHTPGGSAEAAETIVDYLWSKFAYIRTIIPTYAMSAGTMIALASNKLVMGRQSQLGPTDPQLIMGNRAFSAHSIVRQFDEAKAEISKNPSTANAWYPVLQPFGPALLQEARKAMAYGDALVERWLTQRMFHGRQDAATVASAATKHFGGSHHGSHGHRINRHEVRQQQIDVDDLETDQALQDAVLSLYHLATLAFERGPAVKVVISSNGSDWIKNMEMQVMGNQVPQPATP